jgi:hypothetical protein
MRDVLTTRDIVTAGQGINTSWRDVMATDSAQAFLACGGMFFLSFFMIWAFWFVERLRGTSAPQLQKAAPLQK